MAFYKTPVFICHIFLYQILIIYFIQLPASVLCRRPLESPGFFEGDINLPTEEKKAIEAGEAAAGIKTQHYRWPSGIVPYTVSRHYNSRERYTIEKAMKEISDFTCVQFKPKSSETYYIHIEDGPSCSSSVGMTTDNPQVVTLNRKKCIKHGTIIHELLHTLGFYHEQSRTDRDEFVSILIQNIRPDAQHNFHKYTSNQIEDFYLPYDYKSVLHYSENAFVRPDKGSRAKTIVPKQAGTKIGHYCHLSHYDCLKVIRMYCPDDEKKYLPLLKNLPKTKIIPRLPQTWC